MNFLAVILLSLFISVKSLNATKDGTVRKNTNMNAGTAGASMDFSNDAKDESQLTRIRKSVVTKRLIRPCYRNFFVGHKIPEGFDTGRNPQNIRHICQKAGVMNTLCFSTMFDVSDKIPIYSAYVVTKDQAQKFGKALRAGKNFRPEPGIDKNEQGSNEMYRNSGTLPCIHKGHLVPAETYSFSADHLSSTFTYTNAVPQYATFNTGQWSAYEKRIRNYATNECSAQNGDLYLLTGTSDIWIIDVTETGIRYRKPTQDRMPEQPYIVIPNSMWTAGCCVSGENVLGSFAVIGNNTPDKAMIHISQMTVVRLENMIGKNIIGGINLFPGNDDCNNIQYHVSLT